MTDDNRAWTEKQREDFLATLRACPEFAEAVYIWCYVAARNEPDAEYSSVVTQRDSA